MGRKIIDLIGQRFGNLVVLEFTDRRSNKGIIWKCQCDCGATTYVSSCNLRSNHTKSCGCYRKKQISQTQCLNLIGKRFNRLTVLRFLYSDKNQKTTWECICDCGSHINVTGSSLISGNTKSCGCYCREIHTTHGMSYTREYANAQTRKRRERKKLYDLAPKLNYELELALEEFFPTCVICGITREEHIEKFGKDLSNDHVLPLSKGYGLVPGNAVVLCKSHNSSKLNRSLYKLPQDWIDKILLAAKEFEEYWNSIHILNESVI